MIYDNFIFVLLMLKDVYDHGRSAMGIESVKIDLTKQKPIVLIGVSNVSNSLVLMNRKYFFILNAFLARSLVLNIYALFFISWNIDCWPGYWKCRNNRCVSEFNLCDGHDHCRDNSDEIEGCDFKRAKKNRT